MTLDPSLLRRRFPALEGRIYLNAASEGPMPADGIQEAFRIAALKERPWEIGIEYYYLLPASIRERLERWIGAPAGSVALVGGTSAGIGIAARGLPVSPGDEVLLLEAQFPSNVFPWRAVLERGGSIRVVERPFGEDPTAAILAAIGPKTRIVSLDWVNFVDGAVIDLRAVGDACRRAGAFFVLDAAQGMGALQVDVSALAIDVLAAPSHKWMLGPVGLGFVYVAPSLTDVLQPWNSGWVNLSARAGFRNLLTLDGAPPPNATRFETGTPPYGLLSPWRISLDLLAEIGPAETERQVLTLVDTLVDGLRELCESEVRVEGTRRAMDHGYEGDASSGLEHRGVQPNDGPPRQDEMREGMGSEGGIAEKGGAPTLRLLTPDPFGQEQPGEPSRAQAAGGAPGSSTHSREAPGSSSHTPGAQGRSVRSGIVAIDAGDRTLALYRSLEAQGITVAFREGSIRVSPHIYNTDAEIEAFLLAVRGFLSR